MTPLEKHYAEIIITKRRIHSSSNPRVKKDLTKYLEKLIKQLKYYKKNFNNKRGK